VSATRPTEPPGDALDVGGRLGRAWSIANVLAVASLVPVPVLIVAISGGNMALFVVALYAWPALLLAGLVALVVAGVRHRAGFRHAWSITSIWCLASSAGGFVLLVFILIGLTELAEGLP